LAEIGSLNLRTDQARLMAAEMIEELNFEVWLLLAGAEEYILNDLSDSVCSGLYSQVTSQSLSLVDVSKALIHPIAEIVK
jgi:hypothetical protein